MTAAMTYTPLLPHAVGSATYRMKIPGLLLLLGLVVAQCADNGHESIDTDKRDPDFGVGPGNPGGFKDSSGGGVGSPTGPDSGGYSGGGGGYSGGDAGSSF